MEGRRGNLSIFSCHSEGAKRPKNLRCGNTMRLPRFARNDTALYQKSDFSATFGTTAFSVPKVNHKGRERIHDGIISIWILPQPSPYLHLQCFLVNGGHRRPS